MPEPATKIEKVDFEQSLAVLPLGGCGEVGLNCTLIVDDNDALLVDCGVLLGLPDAPGVDRAIPDFSLLHSFPGRIHGVVITHGHEDHIGALEKLLDQFDFHIYGPPLAIKLIRARLSGQKRKWAQLHTVTMGQVLEIGPFDVEWIRVTHSIPDSAALFIQAPHGTLLHTGDFKLDQTPLDGQTTNVERFRAIGESGLDILLADSTNSERGGCTLSESKVGLELQQAIVAAPNRVMVSCFSSHFHRLQSIANAAMASNRKIILQGRALQRAWQLGRDEGYLDAPSSLTASARHYETLPKSEVLILASGTQGEPRAAVSKIAHGLNPEIHLDSGDYFIRSAMTIPGNLLRYRKVVNALAKQGVITVEDRGRALHCSGHAHADEQAEMIRFVAPRYFVPIHGETTMLKAHLKTAIEQGVAPERCFIIEDGESIRLRSGVMTRGPSYAVHPVFLDGVSDRPISWDSVGDRRKVGFGGLVFVSLVVDRSFRLSQEPLLTFRGLPESRSLEMKTVQAVLSALTHEDWTDLDSIRTQARTAVLRACKKFIRVKPVVEVHVTHLTL
ncbi:MAG: ribonuclease J [Myxococcota bacterium]|nr:ribonuclease J [Myxococcota bacterium]